MISKMTISQIVRDRISDFPTDFVFGVSDFELEPGAKAAVVRTLQRMAESGELRKMAKGKYYKPRITVFGELKPSPSQIAKDFLSTGDKITGYLTGNSIFSSLGLTTQISSKIEIGTNKYRHPTEREGYKISFVLQRNIITKENIPVLRLLDCIRCVREIPATTPDDAVRRIIELVRSMDATAITMMADCALNYQPYVRALAGAVLELIDEENPNVKVLSNSLSGISRYRLPISEKTLPNKLKWNIYEPARK